MLHSYPYRETSLVFEVFSRDHGRVALVAKGAKRPQRGAACCRLSSRWGYRRRGRVKSAP
ncbi:MAG: DNA recombination and repair protein RecO [Candidatus Burkholderia crenata]|nr:MAG: DNA recombination and repair protein RecO [Candidatus Burkholderia crenata]